MAQHRTDVLVLGGSLAGLATAALLAKRHCRVVVIGHNELEGHLTLGDLLVAETPFLITDFEAASAIRSVIEELGLRQDVRRLLPFANPPLQLIDASHRLAFAEDPEARLFELQREFGDSGAGLAAQVAASAERQAEVAAWLSAAPGLGDSGFFARRRLTKHLMSTPPTEVDTVGLLGDPGSPLRAWLRALVAFTTHAAADDMPSNLAERAVARLALGVRVASGGERQLLVKLFSRYCTSHGGEILPHARIERVELKRSEVVAELSGENAARVAGVAVDASRGAWLAELLTPARAGRAYLKDREVIQPGSVVEARHMVFKLDALPVALGTKAIVHWDDGAAVLVTVDPQPPTVNEKPLEAGVAAVTAATVAVRAGLPETQERLRSAVLRLMPFADRHLVVEVGGAERARPLYRPRDDGAFSVLGPARSVTTSHARLHRAGDDVFPAWGLEGELRAALKAAELATAQLTGKKARTEPLAGASP